MPILQSIEPRGPALMVRRHAVACHLAGMRMMRALARLQTLVEKGGFNPDQPRVPAGSPEGGQWAGGDGGGQSREPGIGDNGGPALDQIQYPPKDKPSKTQAAKALAKAIARQALRRAGPIGAVVTAIEAGHWLYTEWPSIRSYQGEAKSLGELQEQAGKRRPGYDDHHVVEQGAGSREDFPRSAIDGVDNVVSVPRYKHHEIAGWYNTPNKSLGCRRHAIIFAAETGPSMPGSATKRCAISECSNEGKKRPPIPVKCCNRSEIRASLHSAIRRDGAR